MSGRTASVLRQRRPAAVPALVLGRWTLTAPGELVALRAAVADALREHRPTPDQTVSVAAEHRLLLVVSELATNALKYGAHPVRVNLHRGDDEWLVDVVDANAQVPPVLRAPQPNRVGGNGLIVVDRAGRSWGWYQDPDEPQLKHVWAVVPTSSA